MYEKEALQVGEAIQKLAEKPDNLNNFVSYLTQNFPEWLKRWANTPESLACELLEFANMENSC